MYISAPWIALHFTILRWHWSFVVDHYLEMDTKDNEYVVEMYEINSLYHNDDDSNDSDDSGNDSNDSDDSSNTWKPTTGRALSPTTSVWADFPSSVLVLLCVCA